MFKTTWAITLIAAYASMGLLAARAADVAVPTKAVPYITPATCTILNCSGWYAGVGLSGNGSNLDILSNGIASSVFAGGAALDVHAGYQVWNGNWLFAVEAGLGNQFSNGPVGAVINGNTLVAYEGVKIGGSLAGLLGTSANTTTSVTGQAAGPVTVFDSLANMEISPYIWLGAIQRQGYNQGTTGAGIEYVMAKSWNLDVRYEYAPALDSLSAYQAVKLGLNYHFNLR